MDVPETPAGSRPDGITLRIGGKAQPLRTKAPSSAKVDIGFVFDTTGSMSGKRGGLIESMEGFVDRLATLDLDWRASVIAFGDLTIPGDRIDTDLPFVTSVSEVQRQLRGMPQFSGGGNAGESSIEAMSAALGKSWRVDAVKALVLLTDDHALDDHRAPEITRLLVRTQTLCFAAAIDTPYYREWCTRSGGTWEQISATMDTAAVFRIIESLVSKVATTAAAVHAVGGGSVRTYLEITGRG